MAVLGVVVGCWLGDEVDKMAGGEEAAPPFEFWELHSGSSALMLKAVSVIRGYICSKWTVWWC
jgi:hypothetical protein